MIESWKRQIAHFPRLDYFCFFFGLCPCIDEVWTKTLNICHVCLDDVGSTGHTIVHNIFACDFSSPYNIVGCVFILHCRDQCYFKISQPQGVLLAAPFDRGAKTGTYQKPCGVPSTKEYQNPNVETKKTYPIKTRHHRSQSSLPKILRTRIHKKNRALETKPKKKRHFAKQPNKYAKHWQNPTKKNWNATRQ